MKRIKLTQGQFTLVDDADYGELSKHKWFANKMRGVYYAARWSRPIYGKRHIIPMHRQILGLEYGDPRQADHINHITLDNRHCNLRICTNQQNARNRKPNSNSSSIYKGVFYHQNKKWEAYITINRKRKHLGFFSNEQKAALAYNKAAKRYFGEFACLNLV